MLFYTLPIFLGLAGVGLTLGLSGGITAAGFGLGAAAGVGIPVALNKWMPLDTFHLRRLDASSMTDILAEYVSYFRFDEAEFKEFPGQDVENVLVPYNKEQYSFFLHLVEGDLDVNNLQRLLKNDLVKLPDSFVALNSTSIQENFYRTVGAGRDIGNFEFNSPGGGMVEAPKFVKLLESLQEHDEPTVIYSNYEATGIEAFKSFLVRQKYDREFGYIHPGLTHDAVGRIVESYSAGKIKLLLLHPEITEGISLKGTQYLHILEPIINSTVLEQVIGRTRRFRSHSHLPKEKQLVKVRIWQSTNEASDLSDIYRANWFKRYRELSYMSRWGIGITQVDKKYDRKALNPEELAQIKLETLKSNISAMQEVLTRISIENHH